MTSGRRVLQREENRRRQAESRGREEQEAKGWKGEREEVEFIGKKQKIRRLNK